MVRCPHVSAGHSLVIADKLYYVSFAYCSVNAVTRRRAAQSAVVSRKARYARQLHIARQRVAHRAIRIIPAHDRWMFESRHAAAACVSEPSAARPSWGRKDR